MLLNPYRFSASSGLGGFAGEIMANVPRAFWLLNETSGTTALDLSGNNLHGTYNPSNVTLNQSSLVDGTASILAGGTASQNVATGPLNSGVFGADEFAVLAVVAVADASEYRTILAKEAVGSTYPEWRLYFQLSGVLTLVVLKSDSVSPGEYAEATTSVAFDDGLTHLVIAQRVGNDFFIYVDNVQRATVTFAHPIYASAAPVGIACSPVSSGTGYPLRGKMSHAATFGHSLDSDALDNLWAAYQAAL